MKMSFFLLYFFSLIACTAENQTNLEDLVDQEFIVYFERFGEEAAYRGLFVEWEEQNISANLISISEEAVGQCLTYNNGSRQINIDKVYWGKSNDMEREFLIFHELGHCLLKRTHLDEPNLDGTCLSMMNSGDSLCKKNYNPETRKKYIDELFS